jgi:hypothetical protein
LDIRDFIYPEEERIIDLEEDIISQFVEHYSLPEKDQDKEAGIEDIAIRVLVSEAIVIDPLLVIAGFILGIRNLSKRFLHSINFGGIWVHKFASPYIFLVSYFVSPLEIYEQFINNL